jgi:hypothetical protein
VAEEVVFDEPQILSYEDDEVVEDIIVEGLSTATIVAVDASVY